MSSDDQRPGVWVGHVAIHSDQVAASCRFMRDAGMRLILEEDTFALLEMRGGTHLAITSDGASSLLRGQFDLMVDDIEATHARLAELGYAPGKIERGEIHDSFEVREPGGNPILFNSSHVGDLPV